MRHWWLHLSVFAVGAVSAALAFPAEPPPGGLDAVYEELGLSAVVADEMKKLDATVGPRCAALAAKRRELVEAIRREPHDRAEIDRLAAESDAIRNEIHAAIVDHLVAVKPKLTPEQRAALFDRLAAGRSRP